MRRLAFLVSMLISTVFFAQPDVEKALQTQLILAQEGDEIVLPEGRIELSGSLSVDGKSNFTIRGAGQGKTILSWKNQKTGAEGLKITNSHEFLIAELTVQDAKGDLIKLQHCHHFAILNVTAEWTGKPQKTNGSYAIYPVQCLDVKLVNCTARGASDAGLYVGQSDEIELNGCVARENVAGIEIENSTNVFVHDCLAENNTGGILVFDLPDLQKKEGGNVRVHHNKCFRNNHSNFAPRGNIVGKVPPGTGVMILATNHVEVDHNEIAGNRTASCAIVSYFISEIPIKDKGYNPFPSAIFVHDNHFSSGRRMPTWKNKLGFLFWLKMGRRVPHVLWDGIQNPAWIQADGSLDAAHRICVKNNENGSVANLHADRKFRGISRDPRPFDCEMPLKK